MHTVKSHFKALGLYNFIRGFGWAYKRGGGGGLVSGWAYKRNKKHVSEGRGKTYLRNELKLSYHYISSYINNTFSVRHNKRRIYLKNIYKTDLSDCLKRNAKETHLYSRWAYKRGGGGLISGWAYIRNKIFVCNWMGLYPGGLKTGWGTGGLKVGFYGMY